MYRNRLYSCCRRNNKPQEIKVQPIEPLQQQYEKLVSDFQKLELKINNLKQHFHPSNMRRRKIYSYDITQLNFEE